MELINVKEAVALVALKHEEDCECRVCRAAHGDQEAFRDVWLTLRNELKRG